MFSRFNSNKWYFQGHIIAATRQVCQNVHAALVQPVHLEQWLISFFCTPAAKHNASSV